MLNRVLIVAILLIVLFGLYLTLRHSKDVSNLLPIESQRQIQIADQGFEKWKEFSSPQGYFKVLFPSLPHHVVDKLNDGDTKSLKKFDTYISEKPDGTAFMISRVEFPENISPAEREKLLTDVVNDMLAHNKENKLQLMQLGVFHSYSSVDFALQNQEVAVTGKAFVVKNNLYTLTMLSKVQNFNENQFEFFVNSLQIEKE